MGDRQERAADRLAHTLAAVLLPIARSSSPVANTAAAPEEVDLVAALIRLADSLRKFAAEALIERVPADRWLELAEILAGAARACRRQVTLSIDQIG